MRSNLRFRPRPAGGTIRATHLRPAVFLCLLGIAIPAVAAAREALPPSPVGHSSEALESADSLPSLVVLVRHAERDGPSASDPGLTPLGTERAEALARLLADAGIGRIHSSDTRRARDTAAPLAEATGLTIGFYDPRALDAFAARLMASPGRHLIVGHSNTTDELSVLLGGVSHGPIVEEWEYDRLYFLTPAPGGGMHTILVRFGPGTAAPPGQASPP